MSTATPKTIDQAIETAIQEWAAAGEQGRLAPMVRARVRDFLAQRFGAAMLVDDGCLESAIKKLWIECLGTESGITEERNAV